MFIVVEIIATEPRMAALGVEIFVPLALDAFDIRTLPIGVETDIPMPKGAGVGIGVGIPHWHWNCSHRR